MLHAVYLNISSFLSMTMTHLVSLIDAACCVFDNISNSFLSMTHLVSLIDAACCVLYTCMNIP